MKDSVINAYNSNILLILFNIPPSNLFYLDIPSRVFWISISWEMDCSSPCHGHNTHRSSRCHRCFCLQKKRVFSVRWIFLYFSLNLIFDLNFFCKKPLLIYIVYILMFVSVHSLIMSYQFVNQPDYCLSLLYLYSLKQQDNPPTFTYSELAASNSRSE